MNRLLFFFYSKGIREIFSCIHLLTLLLKHQWYFTKDW